MNQEELIRQIMSEVMKDLGSNDVEFTKNSPAPSTSSAPVSSGAKLTVADYPLAQKHPDRVKSNTGKVLSDLTFEKVKSGELKPDDFKISADTLELQAEVAEAAGRPTLARNLRRAAELIVVPDDRLLEIYDALRPYRSSKQELLDIADELQNVHKAAISADFVREAADVYEKRDRLRRD